MRSGVCPKCESHRVFVRTSQSDRFGFSIPRSLPVGAVSRAAVELYVCVECGFVEEYVSNADSRDEIAGSWQQVQSDQSA